MNTDVEMAKIVACVQRGDKLIICKNGAFNPSYLVSIMEDRESHRAVFEYLSTKEERERKELELASEPSSFAKALSNNLNQLGFEKSLLN